MNRVLLTTILVLIHGSLLSQNRTVPDMYDLPGERQIKRFTSDDGLPANTLFSMLRDEMGFFWLMTSGGVSRFDGYTFYTVELPADPTTGAKETYLYKARLLPTYGFIAWSSSNIYRLNQQTSTFDILPLSPMPKLRLDSDVFEFKGELVLSNADGLFHITSQDTQGSYMFTDIVPLFDFSFLNAIERSDTIWVVESGKIVRITDFDKKETVASLPSDISYETVLLHFTKNEQLLWVSMVNGLKESWLALLNTADGTIISLQEFEIVISGISQDRKGRLWISTPNDGLYVRQADGILQPFSLLTDKLLFPPQIIDNVLWLNTNGNGLVRIDLHTPRFGLIPLRQTFGEVIIGHLTKNIYLNEHRLWLLNHEPPYHLFEINRRTGTGRSHTFPNGRETVNINDFATLDGRIFWFAAQNTPIMRYDTQTGERSYIPRLSNTTTYIQSSGILALTPQELWIASNTSIGHYDIATEQLTAYEFPDASKRQIGYWQFDGFIDTSEDYLWFPIHSEIGKFHIPSKTFSFITIPQAGGSQIKKLAFHKGRLAAAIENGFALVDTLSGRIDFFDTRQGLPDNFIYGFLEDNNGYLWLSSNRGLTRAKFEVSADTATATFQNFGYSDGIQSNEFNTYAFFKEDDGTMWFGGIGGLNWFNPDQQSEPRPIIPIHFTQLRVPDSPMADGVSLLRTSAINLEFNQRTFIIDFVAIDPLSPDNLRYAYMLEGFDNQWINNGTQRSARLTNIPSGAYRLGVRVSRDSDTLGEPIWLPITIAAPFWQKPWFLASVSLLLVGIVFGVARLVSDRRFRARIVEFEKRELINQERARIARDLHDEIGANLSQIALLSDIILQKFDESPQHDAERNTQSNIQPGAERNTQHNPSHDSDIVRRVALVARENITNLSEIVWSLNPQNDNLEDFASYVQEYTENFFEPTKIRTMFEIDESFPEVNLDSNMRHHLLMSIKEILNNCVKHAQPKTVNLNITYASGTLKISIRDDGSGFNSKAQKDSNNRGNGLRNLRNRVREFGGGLHLESSSGNGCLIEISIPV